jgi:hypothetical protein
MEKQIKQARIETARRIITSATRSVWVQFKINESHLIKVWVQTFHNDEDIEYNQFRQELVTFCSALTLSGKTCETLSDVIYTHIAVAYPSRNIRIQVSKSGNFDCGSYFEYNTTKPLQSLSI